MTPPILFLEMKLHNPVPDEPAFTEADYELYAEMGQLEELIEIDPNESMSAVDVRFANEVRRYRKQDLVDGWPYFKSIVEKVSTPIRCIRQTSSNPSPAELGLRMRQRCLQAELARRLPGCRRRTADELSRHGSE